MKILFFILILQILLFPQEIILKLSNGEKTSDRTFEFDVSISSDNLILFAYQISFSFNNKVVSQDAKFSYKEGTSALKNIPLSSSIDGFLFDEFMELALASKPAANELLDTIMTETKIGRFILENPIPFGYGMPDLKFDTSGVLRTILLGVSKEFITKTIDFEELPTDTIFPSEIVSKGYKFSILPIDFIPMDDSNSSLWENSELMVLPTNYGYNFNYNNTSLYFFHKGNLNISFNSDVTRQFNISEIGCYQVSETNKDTLLVLGYNKGIKKYEKRFINLSSWKILDLGFNCIDLLVLRNDNKSEGIFDYNLDNIIIDQIGDKIINVTESCVFEDLNFSDPLPVELANFSGSLIMNQTHLSWSTVTEINTYGFEVYRNGQKVGFIAGHGISNSPKNYKYIDELSESGIYKYELKIIDTDGSFEFSNSITINYTTTDIDDDFTVEPKDSIKNDKGTDYNFLWILASIISGIVAFIVFFLKRKKE